MSPDTKYKLQQMAPMLQSLSAHKADAEMRYCTLSDAVFWNDEVPSNDPFWPSEYNWIMRFIFRYRTSLWLGKPEKKCEEVFETGKALFPKWIGFSEERMRTSGELLEFYYNKRAKASL